MTGLIPKTSGAILVNGVDLEANLKEVREITGMVPQDLALYPMLTVKDNLYFFADILGLHGTMRERNIEFTVATTMLGEVLGRKVQNLSGGLKRRLNLAIGLLNRPNVLFLDEPTVGIDPQTRSFILQSIKDLNSQGMTIVYTSHYMDEVQQICDYVAIIDHGSILVQDRINHLLGNAHHPELRIVFKNTEANRICRQLTGRYQLHCDDPCSLHIQTDEPMEVLRAIAEQLSEPTTAIERIAYGHQNLEDLFLSLTGRETRDDNVR